MARHGRARPGVAVLGKVGLGEAWMLFFTSVTNSVNQARPGWARDGELWYGVVRQGMVSSIRPVLISTLGTVRRGVAWHGAARHGMGRLGRAWLGKDKLTSVARE